MAKQKHVYFFGNGSAEGRGDMKDLLGGKGAGLAEMTNLGIRVPAGFTITTEACIEYYKNNETYPPGMWAQVIENLKKGEESMGFMFGSVVMGIERVLFEEVLQEKKDELKVRQDTELDAAALKDIVGRYKKLVRKEAGQDFPMDPLEQLMMASNAVFGSWNAPRAVTYRKIHNLPHDMGTAASVVAMVFGNMGDTAGTGVAFTRDPNTGERRFFGECLMNAQGEDVVAGIRTPFPIEELKKLVPQAYNELMDIYQKLEKHYKEMLDIEFTIQEGTLYMLQTRSGKRTAAAAIRIAGDMVKAGLID